MVKLFSIMKDKIKDFRSEEISMSFTTFLFHIYKTFKKNYDNVFVTTQTGATSHGK